MAMVRGNVSVHLSDHSEIDMADKGNHTDVTKMAWVVPSRIVFDVSNNVKQTITQSNQEFL